MMTTGVGLARFSLGQKRKMPLRFPKFGGATRVQKQDLKADATRANRRGDGSCDGDGGVRNGNG